MTDEEIMIYRFKHPSIGVTELAARLGIDRELFVEAVERALKEESNRRKVLSSKSR